MCEKCRIGRGQAYGRAYESLREPVCVYLWERRTAGRTVDQGLACGMQASGKDDGGSSTGRTVVWPGSLARLAVDSGEYGVELALE